MEEETQVAEETSETPEEEVEEVEQEEGETLEAYKARLAKAEELAQNYKIRAEKAEKKAKTAPKAESSTSLPQSDIIYLAKADIHEDDIEQVTGYAEKMGVSVKEAHQFLTPILERRAEERQSAATTETKSGRGKKPKTGEDYLDQADKTGEIPTSDEEMQKLILARQKRGK